MNHNALRGTGVAIVTPFKTDGSIDFDGLQNLVNHLIDGGVTYLVVLGTTGEAVTQSLEEQATVVEAVKQTNAGRLPLVIGIGGNNTAALLEQMEQTDFEGIDYILSASPAYNKPTQEGIYQHYKSLAAKASRPIILYNVPGRTASNMTADTTLRLAKEFDNIIAVKEASGNFDQIMQIIDQRPEGFLVLSGDDAITLPMIACGADGVISVVANAYPQQFSDMVSHCLAGDFAAARPLHYQMLPIIDLLFKEGNPGGVKASLEQLRVCGATMRQPLWPISAATKAALLEAMAKV